jgi:hypothetical protein
VLIQLQTITFQRAATSTSTSANATQETVVGKVASVISRPGAGPDGQGEVVIKLQDGGWWVGGWVGGWGEREQAGPWCTCR